jgi:sensor histidine kinase regulating citrate/malate metabolism
MMRQVGHSTAEDMGAITKPRRSYQMSISHQIVVKKDGGYLHCTSTVGQGTTFQVKIPMQSLECGVPPAAFA